MSLTVAVTGMSGLMGSRFEQLYSSEFRLVNLDLTTGVDITDLSSILKAVERESIDAFLHLAAYTNVSEAHHQHGDEDGLCYKVNVVGTKNVVAAASHIGAHLIHVSTDFVFDGEKDTPYTEEDAPNPIEWYGMTKFEAEKLALTYAEHAVILRPSYPYQKDPARPDFLHKLIDNLKAGTLPPQFSDHCITPTFVDDICSVFRYCILHTPTGIYHATGSSWHSNYDIAQKVNKVFDLHGIVPEGSLSEYLQTTSRPYQKTLRTDNSKLVSEFELQMKTLDEGLEALT